MDLRREAVRLKQVIDTRLATSVKIKLGAPGALDVIADGQTVFSHKQTGAMPDADDIVTRLRSLAGGNS